MSSSRFPSASPHQGADVEVPPRAAREGGKAPLVLAALASLVTCGAIVTTSSHLVGWSVVLTLSQAAAMLACSRDLRAGWAFGLGLQAPWITYDVVTGQFAFIATSLIVSVAQISALMRLAPSRRSLSHVASGPTAERSPGHAGRPDGKRVPQ